MYLPGREKSSDGAGTDELFVHGVIGRMRQGSRCPANRENHPGGTPLRKRFEIGRRRIDERGETGMFSFRRSLC